MAVFGLVPVNTQTPAANPRHLQWESIGEPNEFTVAMPSGFKTVTERDVYLGSEVRAEATITFYRYINGVVLIVQYIQRIPKDAAATFAKRERLEKVKSSEINGFQFDQFDGVNKNHGVRVQAFRRKDRLYLVRAIGKDLNDPIITDFFSSVKLILDRSVQLPNIPLGETTVTLKNIVEPAPLPAAAINAVSVDEVDRGVIILKRVLLVNLKDKLSGSDGSNFSADYTVEYLADGTIGNIDIVKISSERGRKHLIDILKKDVFIPADKDGSPVTVKKPGKVVISTTVYNLGF